MKSFIVLVALVVAACASNLSEQDVKAHWEAFKDAHGKTYENEVEEMHRMKIFKENLIRINKHNARFEAGEETFTVGVNRLADMHSHEVVEQLNGLRMELKQKSDKTHQNSNINWPWTKTVDWRKHGYVTPVKDQGQCGSCWSFSATGSLEGQLFKKTGSLVSLSEQNLVDCSSGQGNQGCDGGLMDSAFTYVEENGGIDTEASYPYTAEDGTCAYKATNSAGTDSGFVDIDQGSEEDLKDALTTVGPISVAIDASNWSFQMYKSGIYNEPACSSDSLDHGVLAVGYGSEWLNKEFWIVKNSWGASWGEEGYIRMARNKSNMCGIATMASYPEV